VPYIISIIAFFWAAKTLPKDWAEAEERNNKMMRESKFSSTLVK
jgi:hypothetical protein